MRFTHVNIGLGDSFLAMARVAEACYFTDADKGTAKRGKMLAYSPFHEFSATEDLAEGKLGDTL